MVKQLWRGGNARVGHVTLIAAFVMAMACDASTPLAARTNEPMVYLVLAIDPPFPAPPGVFAVVANTGAPGVLDLRPASRLVLRRRGDMSTFAWRPANAPPSGVVRGNYELLESPTIEGLGWRSLAAGERYDLEVETDGHVVHGSTRIPERPVLRLHRGGGVDTVIWDRADGAIAYRFLDRHVAVDTFFVVAQRPDSVTYYVTAFEQNLQAYLTDATLVRSGITGSFGLFGAQITATITVPGMPSSPFERSPRR